MRILIADDHALMREGMLVVLSRIADEVHMVEASNYAEAGDLIIKHEDLGLVLIDLTMPGGDPFTELDKIIDACVNIPVVVISASESPADMRRAIKAGAKGYLHKAVDNDVLMAAIDLVLSGGIYLPSQLLDYPVVSESDDAGVPADKLLNSSGELLTKRQTEVVGLLAKGLSNKEIGRELGLSEGTVRTHISTIFRILEVNNRTQASVRARELNLL